MNNTKVGNIPSCAISHIAFIMDGNGRWAKKRLFARSIGHKKGVERINEIFDACYYNLNIKHISLFVFSTENWKRSQSEIDFLFKLLNEFFTKNIDKMIEDDCKINVLGNLEDPRIPADILKTINEAMARTSSCKSGTFNVLFNYSGQYDIVQATKKIATLYKEGKISLDDITTKSFNNYLLTNNIPELDLLVRTSGEERISNCFLYQLAYSELVFPSTYWPDFDTNELYKVIETYNKRNRRFGGVENNE